MFYWNFSRRFFDGDAGKGGQAGAANNPAKSAESTEPQTDAIDANKIFSTGLLKGTERGIKSAIEFVNNCIENDIDETALDALGEQIFKKQWKQHGDGIKSLYASITGLKSKSKATTQNANTSNDDNTKKIEESYRSEMQKITTANSALQNRIKEIQKEAAEQLKQKEINLSITLAAAKMPELSVPKYAIQDYIANRQFEIDSKSGQVTPLDSATGAPYISNVTGKTKTVEEDFRDFCYEDANAKNLIKANPAAGMSSMFSGAPHKLAAIPTNIEEYKKNREYYASQLTDALRNRK